MTSLDYTALSAPVRFKDALVAPLGWILYIEAAAAIGSFVFGVLSWLFFGFSSAFIQLIFVPAFMVLASYAGFVTIRRHIRLRAFAEANNLSYLTDQRYDGRPGVIFNEGDDRRFSELLVTMDERPIEFGNYQYETGSGKNRQTHVVGFVHVKLPRRLPNMVLDAKSNNFFGKFSNLPVGFSRDQVLQLEGDFNNYFTLYAPATYKQDALYVFTPDVMQALVEAAQHYDCEVVDDSFYLYTSTPLALDNKARLEEMFDIVAKIHPELTDQTDYYADERVGDRFLNVVAAPGARLKTRLSTLHIVIFTIIALWIGLQFIVPVFQIVLPTLRTVFAS